MNIYGMVKFAYMYTNVTTINYESNIHTSDTDYSSLKKHFLTILKISIYI